MTRMTRAPADAGSWRLGTRRAEERSARFCVIGVHPRLRSSLETPSLFRPSQLIAAYLAAAASALKISPSR
jgi:hypothetical protein